jgi:NADPH:quinone reductase-like Zn-dependent oxidoreductase
VLTNYRQRQRLISANYRDTPDWHLAVQEMTEGEGATHILEVGGQDTYERSLQCLAPNGTIAQIGVLTGFDLRPNLFAYSGPC